MTARNIIADQLEDEFGVASNEKADEIIDALNAAGYRVSAPFRHEPDARAEAERDALVFGTGVVRHGEDGNAERITPQQYRAETIRHFDPDPVTENRADWLVDAVATATQNRMFLRGDPECDEVACDAIYRNAVKAIRVAIVKARLSAAEQSLDP